MNKLADLISRWDEDEGKPYKGQLFDFDSYDGEGEPPLSCMCAQGQVLHVVAGWSVDDFRESGQTKADREVAKLLNISTAHSILLRTINDKRDGAPSVVLTDPGKVLGDQWSKLLDFWWHLDQMTAEQWAAARDAAGAAAEIQGAAILKANDRGFYFLPKFGLATPDDIPARPVNYGEAA